MRCVSPKPDTEHRQPKTESRKPTLLQTLFSIPHAWFQGPLLLLWLIGCAIVLAYQTWRHGWKDAAANWLPIAIVGACIVWWVLPMVEVFGVDPTNPLGPLVKHGLAIRGYGVFMVLGIAVGTALVLWRCRQTQTDPEQIITLAFWMIVCGIAGARTFFVIQNWDQFFGTGLPLGRAVLNIVDMTKGGLVVYGSLIGGMLAAIVFFHRTRLPFSRLADLIAPGMVLGLAFGRLGCLMNGCCFGGVCSAELPAIHFPAGSPPYMRQLEEGQLLGLKTTANESASVEGEQGSQPYRRTVQSVAEGSLAEQLKIQPGQPISIYPPDSLRLRYYKNDAASSESLANDRAADQAMAVLIDTPAGGRVPVSLNKLPSRSLGVHPTQIYSAITAALLCATLWFYWPVRRFDGEVFALMLILYSVARFLHEIIRRDELGQFGTQFTISQWVSFATILLGFGLFTWFRMTGRDLALDANPE